MPRIPLLSGSRLVVAQISDDDVVLRPPPPGEGVADVGAAVRDALRFPLEGDSLETLARGCARATVVVEPPALPLPGAAVDPRQLAVTAVVEELEGLGIATGYQTILVAGGLGRRLPQRELAQLVTPDLARRFHGSVVVHDAEDPELGAPGWQTAVELERALARRVPLIGTSLVLNQPLVGGAAHGYPYEEAAAERIARSPLRGLFGVLPGALRATLIRSLPLELTAAAAFAGPPSV